jgi:hypothetical protein
MIRPWEDTEGRDERSLTQKAQMFAGEVNNDRTAALARLCHSWTERGARASVIDMSGKSLPTRRSGRHSIIKAVALNRRCAPRRTGVTPFAKCV